MKLPELPINKDFENLNKEIDKVVLKYSDYEKLPDEWEKLKFQSIAKNAFEKLKDNYGLDDIKGKIQSELQIKLDKNSLKPLEIKQRDLFSFLSNNLDPRLNEIGKLTVPFKITDIPGKKDSLNYVLHKTEDNKYTLLQQQIRTLNNGKEARKYVDYQKLEEKVENVLSKLPFDKADYIKKRIYDYIPESEKVLVNTRNKIFKEQILPLIDKMGDIYSKTLEKFDLMDMNKIIKNFKPINFPINGLKEKILSKRKTKSGLSLEKLKESLQLVVPSFIPYKFTKEKEDKNKEKKSEKVISLNTVFALKTNNYQDIIKKIQDGIYTEMDKNKSYEQIKAKKDFEKEILLGKKSLNTLIKEEKIKVEKNPNDRKAEYELKNLLKLKATKIFIKEIDKDIKIKNPKPKRKEPELTI